MIGPRPRMPFFQILVFGFVLAACLGPGSSRGELIFAAENDARADHVGIWANP